MGKMASVRAIAVFAGGLTMCLPPKIKRSRHHRIVDDVPAINN